MTTQQMNIIYEVVACGWPRPQAASTTPRCSGKRVPWRCWVRVGTVLTKRGFGPGKMEALLNKHKRSNCGGLESSMPERDGVSST
jgi:hypothetical protein